MALTELGFKRRTYDEILSGKIEKAKEDRSRRNSYVL